MATLLLVLAAGLSLPLAASGLLLAAELAFAVAIRLRSSAYGQQQRRSRIGSRSAGGAAPVAGGTSSAAMPDTIGAQALLQKLLDPAEGHLPLLRGGQLLAHWFQGGLLPHQLDQAALVTLLEHLLLPGWARNSPVVAEQLRAWAATLGHALGLPHDDSTSATTAAASGVAEGVSGSSKKVLAPCADPLVMAYRPLLFYLLTESVAAASHVALSALRFGSASTPRSTATVYDSHSSSSPSPTSSPRASTASGSKAGSRSPDADEAEVVVFLHGIGLGLAPYVPFLARLAERAGRGRRVVAVQFKHVSMRLTSVIPSPQEIAADVIEYLQAQGITKVSIVAHSYGTLVASSLNKQAPSLVARLTLVDPVCFGMFLPNLVRNTMYPNEAARAATATAAASVADEPRVAQQAGDATLAKPTPWWAPILRHLLKGLVVAEFHCSVALRRKMQWAQVNMWPSELPPGSTIVLSGRDNLVPVQEVRAIMAQRAEMSGQDAPTVLYNEEAGHGGFLSNERTQASIIAAALNAEDVPITKAAARPASTAAAPAFAAAAASLLLSLLPAAWPARTASKQGAASVSEALPFAELRGPSSGTFAAIPAQPMLQGLIAASAAAFSYCTGEMLLASSDDYLVQQISAVAAATTTGYTAAGGSSAAAARTLAAAVVATATAAAAAAALAAVGNDDTGAEVDASSGGDGGYETALVATVPAYAVSGSRNLLLHGGPGGRLSGITVRKEPGIWQRSSAVLYCGGTTNGSATTGSAASAAACRLLPARGRPLHALHCPPHTLMAHGPRLVARSRRKSGGNNSAVAGHAASSTVHGLLRAGRSAAMAMTRPWRH